MTIGDRFNDCDCCGYGRQFFTSPSFTEWYIPIYMASSSSRRVEKFLKSDGSSIGSFVFVDGPDVRSVDSQTNFYVSRNNSNFVRKYSGTSQLWEHTDTDLITGAAFNLHQLAIGPDFSVHYVGTIDGSPTAQEKRIKVVKLDSSGGEVWSVIKTPPTNESYEGSGCAVDSNGNVFVVAGRGQLVSPFDTGPYDFMLDADGDDVWSNLSTGGGQAKGISAFFSADEIAVATYASGSSESGFLRGYNADGSVNFTNGSTEYPDFSIFGYKMVTVFGDNAYAIGVSSPLKFSKWSGMNYTNKEWEISFTFSGSMQGAGIWEDIDGDVYISYGRFVSPDYLGELTKRSGVDGSEIYSQSFTGAPRGTSNSNGLSPLIPPGRPPVF